MDDYYKEMEIGIIQANVVEDVVEDRETIVARFLNWLNRDIANVIKLQYYMELKDIVHIVMNIKRYIKRRGSSRPQFNSTSSFFV
jgi:hypothetical protein